MKRAKSPAKLPAPLSVPSALGLKCQPKYAAEFYGTNVAGDGRVGLLQGTVWEGKSLKVGA